MQEGEVLRLDASKYLFAQRYIHAYARSSGKRFQTEFVPPHLVVKRLAPDEERKPRRLDHPIWDMEVGDKIKLQLYEYSTTPPNKFAYRVAAATGRKFKCRPVKGELCTWTIERTE